MHAPVVNIKSLVNLAREAHDDATQKALAASDASHPLRQSHAASVLQLDARNAFQHMGQTLVPELLRELDETRSLLAARAAMTSLSPQDVDDLRGLRLLAREHGWSMANAKPLLTFMSDLIDGLTELTSKPKGVAEHALTQLKEWWTGNELRYAEVSGGRKACVMVTLWQIDAEGNDVKVGHAEGETLEEAVQRAHGTILL